MTNDGRRKATPVHGGWDDDELFDRAPARDVPYETTMAKVGRVVSGVQSVILLVTAVVVGGAVFAPAKVLRRVLLVQTVVFLLVAAFGLAVPNPLGLNGPDHILHGILFLLGFGGAYVLAAGILEPGELGSDPSAT